MRGHAERAIDASCRGWAKPPFNGLLQLFKQRAHMVSEKPKAIEQTFRIKAVARMTGLSEHVLCAWERRYGLVEPRRTTGGNRVYTRKDIGRLALVKRLVGAGDRISDVASLGMQQLEERYFVPR